MRRKSYASHAKLLSDASEQVRDVCSNVFFLHSSIKRDLNHSTVMQKLWGSDSNTAAMNVLTFHCKRREIHSVESNGNSKRG